MSDKLQFVGGFVSAHIREPRQTEVCRTFSKEARVVYRAADLATLPPERIMMLNLDYRLE